MNQLLFDRYPLVVNPQLAKLIGLNEAIILQQVHYWAKHNEKAGKNYEDGEFWTYNTYEEWQRQFPFWSTSTIRRTISRLQNIGLLVVGRYNRHAADNTKWYRIDYRKLAEITKTTEQATCSKWADDLSNENRPIPETIPETRNNTLTKNHNSINMNKKDKQPPNPESEYQIQTVFNTWNDSAIKKQEKLTDGIRKTIVSALKYYTLEQILDAIRNYALILNSPEFWFEYRWTLGAFLDLRHDDNITKFINLKEVRNNYRRGNTVFENGSGGDNGQWPTR